jgi:DNA-binding PucR family transcriptional regulator
VSARRRGWRVCRLPSPLPAAPFKRRSPLAAGAFSLPELGIRPAILADEALGEVFCARHLEPLASLGRLGGELEATLRAFFEHDLHVADTARALHVHPNTLHNRLRRYEEATGASLRRQADLVEMWWALERLRLG